MAFGFGQLVDLLWSLHPAAERSTLAARLKYFQRGGFPSSDINVGTGARTSYNVEPFWQIVFVFELLRFGLPPALAMSLVRRAWPELAPTIGKCWILGDRHPAHDQLLTIRMPVLGKDVEAARIEIVPVTEVGRSFATKEPRFSGFVVVDITRLVRTVRLEQSMRPAQSGWLGPGTRALAPVDGEGAD